MQPIILRTHVHLMLDDGDDVDNVGWLWSDVADLPGPEELMRWE